MNAIVHISNQITLFKIAAERIENKQIDWFYIHVHNNNLQLVIFESVGARSFQ